MKGGDPGPRRIVSDFPAERRESAHDSDRAKGFVDFPGLWAEKSTRLWPRDTWAVNRRRPAPPLFIAAVCLSLSLAACGSNGSNVSQSDRDKAVDEAQAAFHQVQASGQDLSAGPCISESLPGVSDWVADVAHDPRQPIDDEPGNQCQRYRSGEAHHFVELGLDGRLIRAE